MNIKMSRSVFYILLLLSVSVHWTVVNCDEDPTAEPQSESEPEPESEPTPEETPTEEPTAAEPEPAAEENQDRQQETRGADSHVSTTCGGILHGMMGEISYKNGQLYDNNERCTWIVQAPQTSRIDFTLEEDGIIQKKEDYVKIAFFNNMDYKTVSSFNEITIDHTRSNKTISVPGPVAYVRFFSDAKVRGLGFRLTFKGIESTEPHNFTHHNYFYNGTEGVIKYFNGQESEIPLERSSFVIQPSVPSYTMAIKYFGGKCDGKKDERDALTIYQRGSNRMSMIKQFCNTTKVPMWQGNSMDEILITYQTTSTAKQNGFHLIWVPN